VTAHPDLASPFHAAADAIEWETSPTDRLCRRLISELRHPLATQAIAADPEAFRRALIDFLKAIVECADEAEAAA
jgi:hypothetical protein